uniref:Uncharacterized protein n=1 Tax=viral metagenome TaxID=1070528 RepID=A0A6C0LJG5_9ZZZZ
MENNKEKEIKIISVEKGFKNLYSINDYDLRDMLKKIAYECEMDIENTIGFADMFYEYKPQPKLDSFKDILINYALTDDRNTPHIILDIDTKSTYPWEYYISKETPSNTIRILLNETKKVIVERLGGDIPLIIPKGTFIDIKTINLDNINDYKNIFLTSKYYNIKNDMFSSYKSGCKSYSNKKYIKEHNYIDLEKEYMEFAEEVNSLYPHKFRDKYYSVYSFIQTTSGYLYRYLIEYLKSGELSSTYANKIQSDYKTGIRFSLNNLLKYKESIKNNIILNIIKTVLPENVWKSFRQNVLYGTIFKTLDDKQKDLVIRNYKMKSDFIESMKNNKCPHLELMNELDTEKSLEKKRKVYKNIKSFIANPEETKTFHTCKRCRFDIICPHKTKTMELILNNASELEIRNALDDYRDRNNRSQYEAFCKICHEELFSNNFEEIQGEGYRLLYLELFKYLWSQALNIFVTLKVTPKVNIFDFCGIIVYGILPIITKSKIPAVNNQMIFYIKTNELSYEFKGIVIMYVYMYILNMIKNNISNPKESYVNIKFDEDVTDKRNISQYAEIVNKRLDTIHRSIFNQLQDMNRGELLISIFSELATSKSIFYMKRVNSLEMSIFDEIIKNTFFGYSFYIGILTDYISISNIDDLDIENYESIVEKILGMKIKSIAKGTEINNYQNLYQPDYENLSDIKLYDDIMSKPKLTLNDLSKITKGRILKCYQFYMKKFKDPSIDLFKLYENEEKIEQVAKIYYKIATVTLDATKKYKPRTYSTDTNITCIYNENGELHKWDILIYSDGSSVRIGTGNLKEYKQIVDYKDSSTDILRSDTNKLNVDKTMKAYIKNNQKKVFFNFFLIKCPEGDIHNFLSGRKCSKCGLIEGEINNEYYKKYYDTFLEEIEKSKETISPLNETEIKIDNFITRKWTKNERSKIELSKIINVPITVFDSIGAMEYRTVNEVMTGAKRPDLPQTRYNTQILLILSHYYSIVGFYNHIKTSIDIDKFSNYIKKSSTLNLNNIADITKTLPDDIYIPYNETITSVFKDDSIDFEEKYKCVLQMICDFVYEIYNFSVESRDIAKYMIQRIIDAELLTCKGGSFDRTVLRSATSVFTDTKGREDGDFEASVDEANFMEEGNLQYEDVDLIHNS